METAAPKTNQKQYEKKQKRKRIPQEQTKAISGIDPSHPLGGNIGSTIVQLMFLLVPFGWSKVLLRGSGRGIRGEAKATPRAPGGPWELLDAFWGTFGGAQGGLGGGEPHPQR